MSVLSPGIPVVTCRRMQAHASPAHRRRLQQVQVSSDETRHGPARYRRFVAPMRDEGTLNSQAKTGSLSDEARYRILVEAIKDYAVFMLDPDGTVASWNAGAQRFKGYAAPEIIGRHFSVFYTPEDREAGLPQLALETAATAGHFEAEGWRVRKDGSRFWTHAVIEPIRNSSGELIGFAKITRDLTERKRVEESLRRSEEQFRLLIQSVTDYAIYMLDTEGRVASWNAGAERIKGYGREEIIGEHFSKFYPDEARERGDPQESLRIAAEQVRRQPVTRRGGKRQPQGLGCGSS
jgi:PAS domain S-box-containing protein